MLKSFKWFALAGTVAIFFSQVLVIGAASLGAGSAYAAARPGYEEAYGMAGCGLGSIAAKEFSWDNGFVQISAATTNGTYGNQTISMTIGISNCDDGLFSQHLQAEQEVFVGANLAQLSKDAARGDGEYILALADLLGCRASSDDTAKFVAVSRESHASIFATEVPQAVLARYRGVIAANNLRCSRT